MIAQPGRAPASYEGSADRASGHRYHRGERIVDERRTACGVEVSHEIAANDAVQAAYLGKVK